MGPGEDSATVVDTADSHKVVKRAISNSGVQLSVHRAQEQNSRDATRSNKETCVTQDEGHMAPRKDRRMVEVVVVLQQQHNNSDHQ